MSIEPEVGAGQLKRVLVSAGASFGLRGEPAVEWIYNPGNFSNASYRVSDGTRTLHVKVVEDPTRPDVWYRLRHRLEREYRAPEILARLDLPDAGLTAYVCPWLPGRAPDPARAVPVLREVGSLFGRLHGDEALAAELASPTVPTVWSAFRTGLFECLSEDLRAVRVHPEISRFHDPATSAWLVDEVETLGQEARRRLSDEPARSPIHGDPWLANLLAHTAGWHLLDWDEMRLGDPAGDWAMLLFEPWVHGARPDDLLPPDPELRRRAWTYLRAAAFDAIVDPLADLTVMPSGLPDDERIRKEKRSVSEAALRRYRSLYARISES